MKRLDTILDHTKEKMPVVHFITNYVTVNDCANITIASGGLPIMADDIQDVEDIVDQCSALVLNIGTLTQRTLESMLVAGKRANKRHCPIILDPVGVGATSWRSKALTLLLKELNFSIIKGNISEVKFLSDGIDSSSGVDACSADIITDNTLDSGIQFAQKLSLLAGSVIAITGPIDIIATSKDVYLVRNGHPFMTKVTGTGCMSGAVMGSYVGANPGAIQDAALAALCAMGICGEKAYEKMQAQNAGLGTYHALLIDYMSALDGATLDRQKKCTSFCHG